MSAKEPTAEKHPGFKLTTVENWLEPDPLMADMVNLNHLTQTVSAVQGTDWIRLVNDITLHADVPDDIHDAFWFASGGIGYAYFYYPIFTVVSQQILRVADFAIDRFYDTRGGKKPRTFDGRLKELHEDGTLDEPQFNRWDGIRRLRNSATHPKWQQNWGLSMSIQLIQRTAESISALPWPESTAG